jgi:hypothetical protein
MIRCLSILGAIVLGVRIEIFPVVWRELGAIAWLDIYCPGCGTIRALDIRTIDRHPLASVGTSWFSSIGYGLAVQRLA